MPNRVDLVPFWLPQMETDIRKPATRKAQIQRPVNSHSNSPTNSPSDAASHDTDLAHYTEPVSDDEVDDDDNRHHAITLDEAGWADLPPQAAAEAKAFRDENAGKNDDAKLSATTSNNTTANGKAAKLQEIFPKLTPANLSKLLDSKYEMERERGLNQNRGEGEGGDSNPSGVSLRPGRVEYVSSFRAQPGKRIAIPVRVEPKVFFANERTSECECVQFRAGLKCSRSTAALSWVEFSVVVSAIGIGILSFSDPHGEPCDVCPKLSQRLTSSLADDIALAAAASFTAVALLSLVYTGYMYVRRVYQIRCVDADSVSTRCSRARAVMS